MEERWSSELMNRKQYPTETVDQFYNALNELWIRLEDEQERYPKVAKTHIFINGLRPELSTAIAPFMSNTLEEVVERAKAFETAFLRNRGPTVVTTNSYLNFSSSNSVENTLAKLAESVNTIMARLDKREASPRSNNYNNYNNTSNSNSGRSRVVCFNCGIPEHISRDCSKPQPRPNNRPPMNNTNNMNNNNPSTNGKDIQGLLAMLDELRMNESNSGSNASSGSSSQENNLRQSFLNIYQTETEAPFYLAKRNRPLKDERADPVVARRKKPDGVLVNGDKAKEAEPQIVVDFEEDPFRENLNPDAMEEEIEPRENKVKTVKKRRTSPVRRRRLSSNFLLGYAILHRHRPTKQVCKYHIWAITSCRLKFETRPSEESPEEKNGDQEKNENEC
ncbi:hypothetical protein Glove_75g26 [Diversispora epigaea]|uniref:CCHC-type domain-containing protein n=1 Tax=Diversispora epigaea TaxID=1348612 RepID=A0A397JJS8_9GLOM|nr:hypothetical protein Glove_75g26 [Diversispora epigaea]